MLEGVQHARALAVARGAVDEGLAQAHGVLPQSPDVVAENNDLVAAHSLVVLDQKLCRHELVGVHNVQQLTAGAIFLLQVLAEELLSHGAPHLGALHICDVARAREVEPVGLVELGADEEVEVADALVLTHQRRGQAELAVAVCDADDLAEHLRRHHVHLVHEQQPPLTVLDHAHHLLGLRAPLPRERNHGERGDADARQTREVLLALRREAADLMVLQVGPQLELMLPLVDRHAAGTQHEAALFDTRSRGHAH
mmetsp:Transcript_18365/g.54815  ORF Transcript_18365/g.54815 Transcript_18365/m.54815 type:complete len:254 (-) Transcript_18365:357-1118(-)